MKKIAFHAAAFMAVFIIGCVAMFPYETLVKRVVDEQIAVNHLPVTYAGITSNPFRTTFWGVEVHGDVELDMGDLSISYSPLSLLTRKVKAVMDSPFGNVEAVHKGQVVRVNGDLDLGRILRLAGQAVDGETHVNIVYDIKEKKGNITLNGGAFGLQTPVGRLVGDSLAGEGVITDNVLQITSLETTGQTKISLIGRLTFDRVNIRRTVVALAGEGELMGLGSKFQVRGTIANPQLVLQ